MVSSRFRPPPRGPLRSSAGDAAATLSKIAQAAVTRPTTRREAAGVTFALSASAVICGKGRRHSGAANAVAGPPGTRSTMSNATLGGKPSPAGGAPGASGWAGRAGAPGAAPSPPPPGPKRGHGREGGKVVLGAPPRQTGFGGDDMPRPSPPLVARASNGQAEGGARHA